MSMPAGPLVTISVVTYDGGAWIEACLRSILVQSYERLELFVLDNGSRDGTAAIARSCLETCSWASVVELGANLGFAAAHNRAIDQASGEVICLLNQDAILDAAFIERAVAALEAHPEAGAIQGLVLSLGSDGERHTIIDSTGLTVDRSRRFASRGQGREVGPGDRQAGPIFGADGPAPVYRMDALRSARITGSAGRPEVLDEDFFLYHEDTDLAWRLRWLGWDAYFEPAALAWHARGLAGPAALDARSLARRRREGDPWKNSLAWRNLRLMAIKNESPSLLLRDVVPILRREIGSILLLLAYGPRRWGTIRSLIRFMPSALRKRRQIQRRRRVSARALRRWFGGDLGAVPD